MGTMKGNYSPNNRFQMNERAERIDRLREALGLNDTDNSIDRIRSPVSARLAETRRSPMKDMETLSARSYNTSDRRSPMREYQESSLYSQRTPMRAYQNSPAFFSKSSAIRPMETLSVREYETSARRSPGRNTSSLYGERSHMRDSQNTPFFSKRSSERHMEDLSAQAIARRSPMRESQNSPLLLNRRSPMRESGRKLNF
jgi:hypothetical protein